jgi:prophage tail gpP-like protein
MADAPAPVDEGELVVYGQRRAASRVNRSPVVQLKVNGQIYSGWTSVDIQRSIETIAGGFSVTMTDYDPALQVIQNVAPGDACELLVDGETIITGYVDETGPEFDADTHEVKVVGRDKTGDMVDCAAYVPLKTPGWFAAGTSPLQIATQIAQPFGISVRQDVDSGTVGQFALQTEETAFAAIDRMAKDVGVLPVSDGLGGVLLTRGGTGGSFSPLEEGVNMLAAKGSVNWRDRFSHYFALSDGSGFVANAPVGTEATATDPAVKRWRPKVVVASSAMEAGEQQADHLSTRAKWEATVHAARAYRHKIVVQGWRDDQNALFQPNSVGRVTSVKLGCDETLLLVSVRWTLDDKGSRTELEVTKPDAFKLIALPDGTDYVTPAGATP